MFIGQNQFCSSDLLAKIADVIDSPVLITRLGNSGQFDQRIIYINPAFTNLTGYGHDELLGRSIDVICDPRTGTSKMLEFYNSCRTTQGFSITVDSFRKTGSEVKLKLDVRPIVDNVQGAYYYIIMCKAESAISTSSDINAEVFQRIFSQATQASRQTQQAQPQYQQPQQPQQQPNFAQAPQYQQFPPQFQPQYQPQAFRPPVNPFPQMPQQQPQQQQAPATPATNPRPEGYAVPYSMSAQQYAQSASEAARFAAMQQPQPTASEHPAYYVPPAVRAEAQGAEQPQKPSHGPDEDFGIPVAPVVASSSNFSIPRAELKTDEKIADYCKTQFLANMSHDLRTPLNAIIGFSEVIKDQLFGPIENNRYVSYASDIHKSGQELLATINEIMELSEIQPEAERIEEEKIDLSDVVESVLDVLSPKAFESDVKIIKSLDAEDVIFQGDRRKLKQVFAGVINNAIKYSKKGSKIELSTSITDKGDYRLVVYAPTAHLASTKSSLGTLLGTVTKKMENDNPEIALARKFIEAHQGKFSVFHSATSGTELNITLPANRISIEPEKKTWLKVIS